MNNSEQNTIVKYSDEDVQLMMSEAYKDVEKELIKIEKLKCSWKKQLKGLINVAGLFRHLDEMEGWYPYGIVDVYETDETRSGYKSYQHVRIKDDKDRLLYVSLS